MATHFLSFIFSINEVCKHGLGIHPLLIPLHTSNSTAIFLGFEKENSRIFRVHLLIFFNFSPVSNVLILFYPIVCPWVGCRVGWWWRGGGARGGYVHEHVCAEKSGKSQYQTSWSNLCGSLQYDVLNLFDDCLLALFSSLWHTDIDQKIASKLLN